jgi:hypothetical protein
MAVAPLSHSARDYVRAFDLTCIDLWRDGRLGVSRNPTGAEQAWWCLAKPPARSCVPPTRTAETWPPPPGYLRLRAKSSEILTKRKGGRRFLLAAFRLDLSRNESAFPWWRRSRPWLVAHRRWPRIRNGVRSHATSWIRGCGGGGRMGTAANKTRSGRKITGARRVVVSARGSFQCFVELVYLSLEFLSSLARI